MNRRLTFTILVFPLLVGCSQDINYYAKRSPVFSMENFFNGDLCAKGIVKNSDQSVSRKFVASINARSQRDEVTLDEHFIFNDGEKQHRLWHFKRRNNQWTGTAGDVIGNAQAEIAGDTLHLEYDLEITLEGEEKVIVNMDDWLHLVDNQTLMGSTNISKWGFNLGEIDIFIEKANCQITDS